MISGSEQLLEILRCPFTRQSLTRMDEAQVDALNAQIAQGVLSDGQGRLVDAPVDGGLLTEDGQVVYPLRDGVYNFYRTDSIAMASDAGGEEE